MKISKGKLRAKLKVDNRRQGGRSFSRGGDQEMEKGRGRGEGIQICYTQVLSPHKVCKHYALESCTSK